VSEPGGGEEQEQEQEQGELTELAAAERDLRRAVVGDRHNCLHHPTRSSSNIPTVPLFNSPSLLADFVACTWFDCLHVVYFLNVGLLIARGVLLARGIIACTWVVSCFLSPGDGLVESPLRTPSPPAP
jgi:hypothetical protein